MSGRTFKPITAETYSEGGNPPTATRTGNGQEFNLWPYDEACPSPDGGTGYDLLAVAKFEKLTACI